MTTIIGQEKLPANWKDQQMQEKKYVFYQYNPLRFRSQEIYPGIQRYANTKNNSFQSSLPTLILFIDKEQ